MVKKNGKEPIMNKKFKLTALILTGILILSFLKYSYAYSQSTGSNATLWNTATEFIGLTPEQNKTIQDLQDEFLKETESIQEKLISDYIELRSMLDDPASDETEILKKHKTVVSMENTLREKAFQYGRKVRAVLTSEQLAFIPPGRLAGFFMGGLPCLGLGRGYGRGLGRGLGLGTVRGFGRGYGRGIGRGLRPGMGRGFGGGMGRGIRRGW